MLSLNQCVERIENEIKNLAFNTKPAELYEPIHYILSIGGKRIRPALVLMGCNLFTEDVSPALQAALAVEVFHNFTLLHDDIMDEADIRRNKPTVHKKWNNNVAILSGDAMLIKSYQFLENIPAQVQQDVFQLFNKTALEVCEGQQMDMNFESLNKVPIDDYLTMIKLKTAVLVAASLKIGARIGGATLDEADKLYAFGLNLGMAFQIQDDYLDVFADEAKFGKSTGGDIVANKKTYLLLHAINLAKGDVELKLNNLLNQNTTDKNQKIAEVTAIYKELNIPKIAEEKIQEYHLKAIQSLESLHVNSDRKKQLHDFSTYLMTRKM